MQTPVKGVLLRELQKNHHGNRMLSTPDSDPDLSVWYWCCGNTSFTKKTGQPGGLCLDFIF